MSKKMLMTKSLPEGFTPREAWRADLQGHLAFAEHCGFSEQTRARHLANLRSVVAAIV